MTRNDSRTTSDDDGSAMTALTRPLRRLFGRADASGTPVPDLSIEVDDLEKVHQAALAAGFAIEYGPKSEPWGVRRFYVRDPFGRLVNILIHE